MKVTINGRDLAERVDVLGKQEQHYFEVVKSAIYLIVGAFIVICLPTVLHLITFVPFDLGAGGISNAFKILR